MRNKNIIGITLTFALSVVALAGCSQTSNDTSSISSSSSSFTNEYGTATTKCAHSGCDSYIASSGDTNCCIIHSNICLECGKYIDEDAMYCMSCLTESSGSSSSSSYSSSSGYSSSSSFTNEYGTATTKCAHSGCDSYIASSGDTNCCIIHSNNCLECGKYIDEDAMYCMSCLTGSSGSSSSSSYSSSSGYSSSSSFTNEYGTATTKCAHFGCDLYIASSGDTNCCIMHSNNCLECGKYIDEDAAYCMSCLFK